MSRRRRYSRQVVIGMVVLSVLTAVVCVAVVMQTDPERPARPEPIPSAVLERVGSAVFQIKSITQVADSDTVHVRYGTAIAIEPRGTFLTALHTVSPVSSTRVTVLTDRRVLSTEITRVDSAHDTAILRTNGYTGSTLEWSPRSPIEGDACYLVGFPTEYTGTVLPEAIGLAGQVEGIDDAGRDGTPDTGLLRVRATTHYGASGGAAVDTDGHLIGMITAARFPSASSDNPSHVLLVPANELQAILRSANNESLGVQP